MKKKVAMIGCGGIGNYHFSHLIQFTDIIEIAGMCDLIPEKAKNLADKAGCPYFTDFKEMYDAVNPDMVFVCVPPYCHGEIEYETIRRRIPMFVEKPVAIPLSLARDIATKVKEAGLITASGFQCRYSNLIEPTKKFTSENKVVFIDCTRIGDVPGIPWWKTKSLSGGQLAEQTIHQLDILRYCFDEPVEVFSFNTRGFVTGIEGYDTDDLSTTVVRFKSGALATIGTGCYAKGGEAFDSKIVFSSADKRGEHKILGTFKVYGETPVESEDTSLIVKGDGTLKAKENADVITYREEGDAGVLCDRTFIEAVISGDGSKIRSPYADALRTLTFALACNESMETGKAVKVQYDY